MRYANCLVVFLFVKVSYAFLLIGKDNVSVGNIARGTGEIKINPNVYFSIWNEMSQVSGLIVSTGSAFYITAPPNHPSLQVSISSTITNEGVVAFNSSQSSNDTSSIMKISSSDFTNSGHMLFIGSDGENVSNTDLSFKSGTNTGVMTFYKASGPNGIANITGNLTNVGGICVYNQNLNMGSGIVGGCIQIQGSSKVIASETAHASVTFVMDGPDAELQIIPDGSKTYTVYGFGNGNKISADGPITSVDYDTDGTLSFEVNSIRCTINIGVSYTAAALVVEEGSLHYNNQVPNQASLPFCETCPSIPQPPKPKTYWSNPVFDSTMPNYSGPLSTFSSEVSIEAISPSTFTAIETTAV